MAGINLLPWRERRRQERRRRFLRGLPLIVLLAAALLFTADRQLQARVDVQQARNDLLRLHSAELDRELAELRELQARQAAVSERMRVIQDLQAQRPLSVRVFEELARTLPEGLHFEKLTRSAAQIQVEGVGDSDRRIAELLRRLEASDWFTAASLQQVVAANPSASAALPARKRFRLSARISGPEAGAPAEEP